MADTQERIRHLGVRMAQLPSASPELQDAFLLAATCKVCPTPRQLIWIKNSRVCACENGHIHSFPGIVPELRV